MSQGLSNLTRESKVHVLNQKLYEIEEKLANEIKRGQMLQESLKASLGWETYEEYIKSLGVQELEQFKYKLEELKRSAERKLDAISGGSSSSNGEHEANLSSVDIKM